MNLELYNFFTWIYEFLKNHPWKRVFSNVSLSNLESVLQRNLRTDIARKCMFKVSGSTNFENFSTYVPVSPKKLDASLGTKYFFKGAIYL